jgi:hypothetical protein
LAKPTLAAACDATLAGSYLDLRGLG